MSLSNKLKKKTNNYQSQKKMKRCDLMFYNNQITKKNNNVFVVFFLFCLKERVVSSFLDDYSSCSRSLTDDTSFWFVVWVIHYIVFIIYNYFVCL